MKNKMMVDCETLDIGERPVLLSIGAVVFDDNQIQDYFEYFINKETAIKEGFTVSQDTLDWWDQQDPDVRAYTFNGEGDIKKALEALVQFYELNECTEIWSKGALADIRWINNALDHFHIAHPWKFSKEFCFRTLLKSVPKFDMPFVGMPHNALDDAIHQSKQFIEIKKIQKGQGGMMDIQKEREAFEKWHFNKYYVENTDKSIIYELFGSKPEYVSYEVQHSWVAWQAAKANSLE